jgi:predicted RecB family nuclease
MRLSSAGTWTFSPTDLATFTRCAHAIQLRKKSRLKTLVQLAPPGKSLRTDILTKRGGEHEAAYLTKLRGEGKRVVEIDRKDAARIERTIGAMMSGADVVFQGALGDQQWSGYADFLQRVERPSSFGPWSYEVADTKLALSVHPYVILQLGTYSRLLRDVQGRLPDQMHIVLGDDSIKSFRCSDYSSYLAHITRRFGGGFDAEAESLPWPVEYCSLCEWNRHCYLHLRDRDSLSLVAGIRRDHADTLEAHGVFTLTTLGRSNPLQTVGDISPLTFERLAHQARLQLEYEKTKVHRYEFLEVEERRGFQLLPKPSPGDMFFDIEADPFADLTYLFGISFLDENREPQYRPWWAHDPREERAQFEAVVDFMIARRGQQPDAHIYHYGPADPGTLKRLMGRYGSRENEIDTLLRSEAFVDLLAVVRQGIRISHPSYSLKMVETFYFDRESVGVKDAGGAIMAYEEWLEEPTDEKLAEIEQYNKDDCDSSLALRTWLLELRDELQRTSGVKLAWRTSKEPEPTNAEREQERMQGDALSAALLEGLPDNRLDWSPEELARWTLAHLLHYHRRDDKPAWWSYLSRRDMTAEDLMEDRESIGMLEPTGATSVVKKSIGTEFRYPRQGHKLEKGDTVFDPLRLDDRGWPQSVGTIEEVDDESGTLIIKKAGGIAPDELPRAITLQSIVNSKVMIAALRRIAQRVLDEGWEGSRYRVAFDILQRSFPRLTDLEPGAPLQRDHVGVDLVKNLARRLDDSYLFVQGPPGSGKTYVGARVIVDLIRRGKRVGVSATSHKAIENLLQEVERVAHAEKVKFRGLKKSTTNEQCYQSPLATPFISDTTQKVPKGDQKPDPTDPALQLVGGTQWLFSHPDHEGQFDVLVIDESGQMSLADALAVSTAAKNVILLGDPLQLAQVSQGTHPEGCGASVLEHLLGSEATIPRQRGIFLEQTWRMHPDVCRFISEVVYAGRLESEEGCLKRLVDAPSLTGTGLRIRAIEHAGNSQKSVEEAAWIVGSIAAMLDGGKFTEKDGIARALRIDDILVVTPYNAQVGTIRRALTARGLSGDHVGTVDKFQGQEAPVVFFSMATSSGEDIPRSLDFLFSRNRLNVAISRAQCLAILVASPRLLDVNCSTVEQMALVNALCRFTEMATNV